MSVKKLMIEFNSAEISEWMAFDQLKNDDYKQGLRSDMMSDEERTIRIKSLLGYKA